jgi:hypothetical protein
MAAYGNQLSAVDLAADYHAWYVRDNKTELLFHLLMSKAYMGK